MHDPIRAHDQATVLEEPLPMERLYPLTFRPIVKRLIWGGRRLADLLDKPVGDSRDYAESWEISDHRDDVSIVANGVLEGQSLRELIAERGEELLGEARSQFPLLVKFLDANQVLSVQVHPDDELGKRLVNDNGKTEAWIILHADPGSLIYAGLKSGVTRDEFATAMELGEVEPLLHRFEPQAGDALLIPAGTVHAIGAGIVLAEIQQMSDATFRVHDWGRVGHDGRPRMLHPEESLLSTDFDRGPIYPHRAGPGNQPWNRPEPLVESDFFAIDRLNLDRPFSIRPEGRFRILIGLEGDCGIECGDHRDVIVKGRTFLVPASCEEIRLIPEPSATLLSCVTP